MEEGNLTYYKFTTITPLTTVLLLRGSITYSKKQELPLLLPSYGYHELN